MASSRGWIPLLRRAVPHRTGTSFKSMVARRMAGLRTSCNSGFGQIGLHDAVVILGDGFKELFAVFRAFSTSTRECLLCGKVAPRVSSSQTIFFIPTRSMTPLKSSSDPMGSWRTRGVAWSLSFIISTVPKKSAPTRSSLLTKAILGTWYLSAWRQTVSDWGSTPPTAQKTPMAPSRTRNERSTSMVKSTWPGVSMIWISDSFQWQVVTAEVMVMPRSCSSGIQSMTASPS